MDAMAPSSSCESGLASVGVPSIDSLLLQRGSHCIGAGGDISIAQAMHPVWQRLWQDFGAFIRIRDRALSSRRKPCFSSANPSASDFLQRAQNAGLLIGNGKSGYSLSSREAGQRLQGRWLEEFGAVIARDAGADEVRFSQKVAKHSSIDKLLPECEIDVLARFGNRLAFVSCKAFPPWSVNQRKYYRRIQDALIELSGWRKQLGTEEARAILLTTMALKGDRQISPWRAEFLAQAERLDVRIVSAQGGNHDRVMTDFTQAVVAT